MADGKYAARTTCNPLAFMCSSEQERSRLVELILLRGTAANHLAAKRVRCALLNFEYLLTEEA